MPRVLTLIAPSFHGFDVSGGGAVIFTLYFCPCSSHMPVPLQIESVREMLSIFFVTRSTAFGRISQVEGQIAKPELTGVAFAG